MDLQSVNKTLRREQYLIQRDSTHCRPMYHVSLTKHTSCLNCPKSQTNQNIRKSPVPSPKPSTVQKLVSQLSQVPNLLSGIKLCTYKIPVGKEVPNVRSCAIHRAFGMSAHILCYALKRVHDQHWSCHPEPSHVIRSSPMYRGRAKDLCARSNTTFPILLVKNHIRPVTTFLLNSKSSCPKSQTNQNIRKSPVPSPKSPVTSQTSCLKCLNRNTVYFISQLSQVPNHSITQIPCPNCPKSQTNQNIAKPPVPSLKLLFQYDHPCIAGLLCREAAHRNVVVPLAGTRGVGTRGAGTRGAGIRGCVAGMRSLS